MVVDAIPQDLHNRAGYLNNLSNWLGTQFKRTGLVNNLNYAINITNEVVNAFF